MLNHAPALSPDELRKRLRPFCEKHHIRRLEVFVRRQRPSLTQQ
jgi:hypothetical protein